MADMIIGSTTIPPFVDACVGNSLADGIYYAQDTLGPPPKEGAPEYDFIPVQYPGADSVGFKNLGFRGRSISAKLVFISADEAAFETLKNAFLDSISEPLTRFSAKVPGGTLRSDCKLPAKGGFVVDRWDSVGGKHVVLADIGFYSYEAP